MDYWQSEVWERNCWCQDMMEFEEIETTKALVKAMSTSYHVDNNVVDWAELQGKQVWLRSQQAFMTTWIRLMMKVLTKMKDKFNCDIDKRSTCQPKMISRIL